MASTDNTSNIFQQVEATANYYTPFTYASLLTYYDDFVVAPDKASGQFIPLTAATSVAWGEQTILFAVGIIPPAANVTGRLLDRTASIPLTDEAADALNAATAGPTKSVGDTLADIALSVVGFGARKDAVEFGNFLGGDGENARMKQDMATAPESSTCGLTVRAIWRNSGLIDDPYLQPPYGPRVGNVITDLISFSKSKGAWIDAKPGLFPKRGAMVAIGPPGSISHVYTVTSVDPKTGVITSVDGGTVSVDPQTGKPTDQQLISAESRKWVVDSTGQILDEPTFHVVNGWTDPDALGRDPPNKVSASGGGGAVGGDAKDGNWKDKGSKDAAAAKQEQAQLAGSPLLTTDMGKALTAAQQATIKATRQAIDAMAKCPPLAMLVSPASFGVKGEKIVSDGNWGRKGPIIEFWGDQQDKISASGKLAGFYAIDSQNIAGPGITRWARNFAASWQNFQSLFQLYRSNGALFLPDDTTAGQYQTLSMLGSIYIYYDNVLYIGSFDDFSITENDTAPHTIEYSFEFTVRASFLLDRTDDAFNYGVPQIPVGANIPMASPAPVSQVLFNQAVPPPGGPFATVSPNPQLPGPTVNVGGATPRITQ